MNGILNKFLKFALGPITGAIIGFITVPMTTWLVSPEQFGLTTMFTLFQTLITSFIYLGIDQAYVREYNEYKDSKKKLLFNAMIVPLVLAGIIMIILAIFMNPISQYLFKEINTTIMIVLIIWLPLVVIERFLMLQIRMQEKGLQYSFFTIVMQLNIMIITIALLLTIEKTYTSIVLGALVGQIISIILLISIYFKNNRLDITLPDLQLIKRMLHYSLPILPAMVVNWMLNSTDRIALDYFSTIENIGIYFAAMKIVSVLAMVQSIFATFWLPIAYRWHEEKVDTKQFTQISYIVMFVMGIFFIGILLFKEVAIWILSPEYSEAQYILPFLLFMPIMYTVSETTVLGISLSRKTHWNIWISCIAAIVNIILNIILVPKIGAIGAAIGTGCAYIVFFFLRTIISRKYWYQFNLSFYVINIMFLMVIATINVFIRAQVVYMINIFSLLLFIILNVFIISKVVDIKRIIKIRR